MGQLNRDLCPGTCPDGAGRGEEDSEVDTTYVVQRGNLTDLSFDVDPDSEDEEGSSGTTMKAAAVRQSAAAR